MRSTYARDCVPLTSVERDLVQLDVPVWCCPVCRRISTLAAEHAHRVQGVSCPGRSAPLTAEDRAALLAIRMGG